jgi:hypothetical protein
MCRRTYCWLQESKQTAHYRSENTQALLSTSGLAALLSWMSGDAVRCWPSLHFNPRAVRDQPIVERAQLLPLPLNWQGRFNSCCQQRGNVVFAFSSVSSAVTLTEALLQYCRHSYERNMLYSLRTLIRNRQIPSVISKIRI